MRDRRVRNKGIERAGVNLLKGKEIAAPKGVLRKVDEKLAHRGSPVRKANRVKATAVPTPSRGLAVRLARVRSVLRNAATTKLRAVQFTTTSNAMCPRRPMLSRAAPTLLPGTVNVSRVGNEVTERDVATAIVVDDAISVAAATIGRAANRSATTIRISATSRRRRIPRARVPNGLKRRLPAVSRRSAFPTSRWKLSPRPRDNSSRARSKEIVAPPIGLEPITARLTVGSSAN